MKYVLNSIFFLSFFLNFNSSAQENQEVIQLWENKIPNSIENLEYQEIYKIRDTINPSIEQVKDPTLTIFKPKKSNGTAILICSGGGYRHLAINKEGYKVAKWLNTLGITAFVLKYRLPNNAIMQDKSIAPLQDAQRAMRIIRKNASIWNLDIDRIGVLGFSAGGHLASTLSTLYDKKVYKKDDETSARPDFSILIYPVISMDEKITHKGSRNNLLGVQPSKKELALFSNEQNVNAFTPKTFLVHSTDDKAVSVKNSIQYYLALKKHKVSAEIHIYQKGGHGYGLGQENTSKFWTDACEKWLFNNGFIK